MGVTYDYTYLSLGAGVQSTTLAVMSALGLHGCPRVQAAIFADTQAEPQFVYDHLGYMETWLQGHGIPLYRVTRASLWDDTVQAARGFRGRALIPAFTRGADGKAAPLMRKCTREYKIEVIEKKVRELLGYARGERVRGRALCLIGISLDEIIRANTNSRNKWVTRAYPLLDARLRREDCTKLLRAHGIPVPQKSACVFCPYHSDAYWRALKRDYPVEFARAVAFDAAIRNLSAAGMERPVYLHRSLRPLGEIDFDAPRDPHQLRLFGQEGFGEECAGVCGV